MSESFATVERPLPEEQASHLSAVCDQFEAEWKSRAPAGQPPRIEDYLGDMPGPQGALLLQRLVLVDVQYRRLAGETPSAADYQARFPALTPGFLAEAFPAPAAEQEAIEEKATSVHIRAFAPQLRSERYAIKEFHAKGGIGEVWLAEDVEIGRQVALKRLQPQCAENQDRFLVEAQVTGQLEHPGIVPVHDLGLDAEGKPFYIMTFVRGRTLKQAIEDYHSGDSTDGVPSEVKYQRLLEVFVTVCRTVAYAHSRGVIHRDLKPANVMLGAYGATVVLDWGLAKVVGRPDEPATEPVVRVPSSGSTETQAGMILGSPEYMAPEVAEGRAGEADERTDVYLLGATLYHLLTGHRPRQGRSSRELLDLARTVSPPAPRKVKREAPRALEAICLKAMASHRTVRYATAQELAEDVERYLAGAPVAAYREPLPARAWRWLKRHRRGVARSLSAALLLLGLSVLGGLLARQAQEAHAREAALRLEAEVREAVFRREAEARETVLVRKNETARRCEQVREAVKQFDQLTEERQFYAGASGPGGEHALYDPTRGEAIGRKALELGQTIAAELEALPLPVERSAFKRKRHDLLLLMVHERAQAGVGPPAVRNLLERLGEAAALQGPSRSYHHLRGRCYDLLGELKQRDAEERQAERLPWTCLDYFFLAEQYRTGSALPHDPTSWGPDAAELARAVEQYGLALRLDPTHFQCHFQLGRCYLSRRQGTEAIEALTRCVALRPGSPWAYSARGLALGLTPGPSGKGETNLAKAEKDLARALELDPTFRPALLNRGVLAWRQGKFDRALGDFAAVLEGPDEKRLIEAAYYRGLLHLGRGKLPDALKDLERVVSTQPTFRPAYLTLAQVHFTQGNNEPGLASLTAFIEQAQPGRRRRGSPEGLALRGRLVRQLTPAWGLPPAQTRATLEQARDDLQTAIEQEAPSATIFDLGAVLHMLGEPREAVRAYSKFIMAAPVKDRIKIKVLAMRGWAYVQCGEHPQALKDFTAALSLDGTNAEARAGVGYVQACRNLPVEAQREAATALLYAPGDYLILHNVACIYAELARRDRARSLDHEDAALHLLRRTVELWRRGGAGPNALQLIRQEPSFVTLRERKEFKQLLNGNAP